MSDVEPLLLHARNPGPLTGDGNNTYLLASSGDAVLIDAGVGHADHLADLQHALHIREAVLHGLVVTHGHADHASGTPSIARLFPSMTSSKFVLEGDEEAGSQVVWQALHDGDRLTFGSEVLRVVHTPGHAPDHVVLWHEATATVFSGDLVIPGRSVAIDTTRGGRMAEYLSSLERVRSLSPRQLFPAHGRVVTDPERVLLSHLAHRLEREQQVLEALAAGNTTVETIADSIYDRLDKRLVAAARGNVRAHLEKLKDEGTAVDHHGEWTLST